MKEDDIFKQLNNPEFRIDTSKLFLEILTTIRMNSYHLKSILKTQLEIKELLQGRTGQEGESNVESKLAELNSKFHEFLKEDMIDDVDFLSSDD
jgi:hypothetical protein